MKVHETISSRFSRKRFPWLPPPACRLAYAEDLPPSTELIERTLGSFATWDHFIGSGSPEITVINCLTPYPESRTWEGSSKSDSFELTTELEFFPETNLFTISLTLFWFEVLQEVIEWENFVPQSYDPFDTGLLKKDPMPAQSMICVRVML